LLVLVRAGEALARSGLRNEGMVHLSDALRHANELSVKNTKDKVLVAVEAGKAFAKLGSRKLAIESMVLAYQLAANFPKEGMFPEMEKESSLRALAIGLEEASLQ